MYTSIKLKVLLNMFLVNGHGWNTLLITHTIGLGCLNKNVYKNVEDWENKKTTTTKYKEKWVSTDIDFGKWDKPGHIIRPLKVDL